MTLPRDLKELGSRQLGIASGHSGERAYRCLLGSFRFTRGLAFGALGSADPRVFSKPLMVRLAMLAIRPAEEYRHGAKGSGVDVPAGKECLICVGTTDHKQTHRTHSLFIC